MLKVALLLALSFAQTSVAESVVNREFHRSGNEGITVFNDGSLPVEIFSRFIIPGLSEKDRRNSGTRYTVMPNTDITYFLPAGTEVIATDGVYWDNPMPSAPQERALITVTSGAVTRIDASQFTFPR